jgi:prepilin-type N-terminal cleavage/methylation domain-containing protein
MQREMSSLDQKGFTLFEVIVSLVLMGIMAVGLTLGLVKVVQSFVFAQEATEVSQKAQLAMARIKKELTDATTVTTSNGTTINYTRSYSPPSCINQDGCSFRIYQSGNTIYLQGISPAFDAQILIDNVSALISGQSFLAYKNTTGATLDCSTSCSLDNLSQIEVSFNVTYGSNQSLAFSTTVNPRSGSNLNIPKLN